MLQTLEQVVLPSELLTVVRAVVSVLTQVWPVDLSETLAIMKK